MERSFQEVVEMTQLKNEQLVSIRIPDGFFKGKVVGLGSSGLIPYYIIECVDGTFPNDIYGFKFLNIPASEIFLNED